MLILTGIFSLVTAVFHTFFLLTDYSPERQHYENALFPALLLALLAVGILGFFLLALRLFRTECPPIPKNTAENRVLSGIMALLYTVFGIYLLFFAFPFGISALEKLFSLLAAGTALSAAVLLIARIAGALQSTEARYICGGILALAPILYAMYLYFEADHFMNNPCILLEQTAFLSLSVYTVMQTRSEITGQLQKRTVLFAASTILLSLTSSLPSILYYFINREVPTSGIVSSVLLFASAISVFLTCYPLHPTEASYEKNTGR